MAASDSSSGRLRSRVRRQEVLAEFGQRALESTDLEESNERLEQFAYAASHDLQEPLRMISSHRTLVEQRSADELDADGEECIEFAVDGAQRMQRTIGGPLEYSRVDSLPRVYGDPGQLRQLFQNPLDNAITYSGDGTPRISVFAENDGAIWQVSVRDRGIGIDSNDTDRIFRVFDRLHSHEEYDGTGIGLALCQRIAERHGVRPNSVRPGSTDERRESVGGEISVDSRPGEGSTVTIELPTAPDADDAMERAPAGEADAETGSTTKPVTDE